ncbi:hypothetical protein [Mycoplasmopsis columboralis]|uniref:hypothetical protein n=1 Tax=Mycoplasmopsis columboralis TaxID=171282 RepID=UPI0005633A76|nr:hypothetical protein [Mycoplasmopsis columboralis]
MNKNKLNHKLSLEKIKTEWFFYDLNVFNSDKNINWLFTKRDFKKIHSKKYKSCELWEMKCLSKPYSFKIKKLQLLNNNNKYDVFVDVYYLDNEKKTFSFKPKSTSKYINPWISYLRYDLLFDFYSESLIYVWQKLDPNAKYVGKGESEYMVSKSNIMQVDRSVFEDYKNPKIQEFINSYMNLDSEEYEISIKKIDVKRNQNVM